MEFGTYLLPFRTLGHVQEKKINCREPYNFIPTLLIKYRTSQLILDEKIVEKELKLWHHQCFTLCGRFSPLFPNGLCPKKELGQRIHKKNTKKLI